jgi:hypothetical protein
MLKCSAECENFEVSVLFCIGLGIVVSLRHLSAQQRFFC